MLRPKQKADPAKGKMGCVLDFAIDRHLGKNQTLVSIPMGPHMVYLIFDLLLLSQPSTAKSQRSTQQTTRLLPKAKMTMKQGTAQIYSSNEMAGAANHIFYSNF